jgi:hypothetical protein
MGPITGLATIATALLVVMLLGTITVVGLTVAFVLPVGRETRTDRLSRRISISGYYLHAATAR